MKTEFSITEVRLIRNLLTTKDDKTIARIIDKPVEQVSDYIQSVFKIPSRQIKKRGRKATNKPKVKKVKPAKPFRQQRSLERKLEKERLRLAKKMERQRIKDEKEKKKLEEKRIRDERLTQDQERALKRKKLERKVLPTRQLDLSASIPVRLNAKTIVYVKPGTDINKLKEKLNIK